MPDRLDDDREFPEEHTPTEGVRILGAQQADVAAGWTQDPRDAEPPRRSRRRPTPEEPVEAPAARFPLPASRANPSPEPPMARPLDEEPVRQWRPQPVEPMPLPHWTEPPTGEVPRIADDEGLGSEPEPAWMSMTGSQPRFRSDAGSWSDTGFEDDFKDDRTSIGALVEAEHVPEDEAFAAAVAARRSPRRHQPAASSGRKRPRDRAPPPATVVGGAACRVRHPRVRVQ